MLALIILYCTKRTHSYIQAPHVVIVTNTHEALWWNMDTLKTNAPDRCSKEAMFDMAIVKEIEQGRCVRFKSYIMDQYLVVTYDRDDDQPQFKFKLSVSSSLLISCTQ